MLKAALQKVTLIDYPGKVACAIFMHGCNFRCPFCHNPELVVAKANNLNTKEEVFKYLELRKDVLDGVVFTGGECLMDKEILEWIIFARTLGYQIKIDTNGSFPEMLRFLIKNNLVDYIAMDIKSDFESYDKFPGMIRSKDIISKILKSIELIKASGVDYEFRTTVVPGLHMVTSFEKMCKAIAGVKQYYIQNFRGGKTVSAEYENMNGFTEADLQQFLSIAKKYINKVELR